MVFINIQFLNELFSSKTKPKSRQVNLADSLAMTD